MERVRSAEAVVTGSRGLVEAVKELMEYTAAMGAATPPPSFREAERRITALGAAVTTAAKADALAAFEPHDEQVEVGGRLYKRLEPASRGRYASLSGVVEIDRHLYREIGVHNGPTVVPLELRAGIVEGRWTPEAAEAVAHLHQALPSREVAATCERLRVLPVSRSTLERGGERLGDAWEERRVEAEDHLVDTMPIPDEATALSVSTDRVTVPMEEPNDDPDRGPDDPKIRVVYRQAFCGIITLHDKDGEPLESVRYGRMPSEGHEPLEDTLSADVAVLKERRPDLRVVGLADGAPEMQLMLDRVLGEHAPEAVAIDFWHLIEKLSAAITATGRRPEDYIPQWKARLKGDDRAIEQIEVYIRTWLRGYDDDAVPDALYDAYTYLDNNRDRMRYAKLRALGLPIGSGHVEATCKTLVSVRMKRAGSRWKERGGQSCLNLRALAQSTRWRAGMNFLLDAYVQPVNLVAAA